MARGLRNNVSHHTGRALVEKYGTLGIDTLNAAGILRAGLQSRALVAAGISDLFGQVRDKAQ